MLALLQRYSVSEILIFIVLLALAIKGVITFIDWVHEKIKKAFNREQNKIDEKKKILDKLDQDEQLIASLQQQQAETDKILSGLSKKIDTLIKSDVDDIRAFITREHHYFCYQKGWIDDFSLECIEQRYTNYVQEGGNSFIKGLMEEIRKLPKKDPSYKD